jgi:UDP-N-acetylmuramate dehydrogenase
MSAPAGILERTIDDLDSRFPGRVRRAPPSGEFTTYRVGGPFAAVVVVTDDAALDALADVLAPVAVPVLVVGRGSNLLVADRGFAGIAIVLGDDFERVVVDAATASVSAGGSASLPVLARRAAAVGVSGLEFYVGIPGSVGGAVRMNAGGHGRETREVVSDVDLLDLRSGTRTTRKAADFDFGYRHSNVDDHTVVCAARFTGSPDAAEACAARIDAIVKWRREHQPGGANAGSVFSNPPGDSAGRLIDAAGLTGLRVGGAVVSEKHANFILADSGATAADVVTLVGEVRRRVADATGIELQTEVRLVGFDVAVTPDPQVRR